ncbi:TolC family protein [Fulvivirgaceae bacterium BMA10]|uniref:TolC family protein n=1 Tax=Splendidivirga corallicola TaxID=3051826 RepID=A0ABT8KPS3_9BACT|nr:TolC family protein [Fulvivirgaceae bacterium BMA10]
MKQFKHTIKISALTVLLGFTFFKGVGQGLDLEAYLSLLKGGSPVLKQSLNQLRSADFDVRSARAALLPSLGAEFNYQRDFTKNFLFFNDEAFGETKLRTNFDNSINADIVARQAIYDPVSSIQHKLAKLAKEQTQITHQDANNALIFQGTKLFWQAIFVKESLKILADNQALAEEQKNQVLHLFDEGLASELEVHQTELYYKRTIPQLASANNYYQTLLNELKALAGLNSNDQLEVEGDLGATRNDRRNLLISDSILTQNLKIQSLGLALKMNEYHVKAKKAAWGPVIKLNLGYNLSAQDNGFRFRNDNQLWYGQISLSIPVFTGGYNAAQLEKARIDGENIRLEKQNTQNILLGNLKNARLNLSLAFEKIEVEKEAILLSLKELEIAEVQAKQGLITPTEYKEIRINLKQARLNLLNAQLNVRLTNLEVNEILGNTLN